MEVLAIPREYIITSHKNRFTTAVHKSWLKSLIQNRRVPEFIPHDTLSLDEVQIWLHQSEDLGPSWQKLIIKTINKQHKKVIPPQKHKSPNNQNELQQLSFAHLLHYISHRNHKHLWEECCRKHGSISMATDKKHGPNILLSSFDVVMRDLIQRVYNCTLINLDSNIPYTDLMSHNCEVHSNILPAICALETSSIFLVIHPYLNFTLQDCITFSPALLTTSHAKPLFIIYQLLQAMRSFHERGLLLGEINFDDIFISDNLWIQIIPRLENNIHEPPTQMEISLKSSQHPDLTAIAKYINTPKEDRNYSSSDLSALCNQWVLGAVSNFDYLTALNNYAGRRFGDPTSHHVMPWVTDFTHPMGGNWRDLSKSKFRLNKGDRQLDLTYDAAAATSQTAHHVSDVLSEITYYVYLARRTPKSALCRHVRSAWVPGEYPTSVQRLQEWTPDECIPEFFTDPSVFESIHADLEDLQLPLWATTPREFVDCHRQALESAHVSERLHLWIDLTFGFKLSGQAAVRAKNVCLHLADEHVTLRRTGVVQLFTRPHPQRTGHAPLYGRLFSAGRLRTNKTERVSEDEDRSSGLDEDDTSGASVLAAQTRPSSLAISRLLSRSRGSLLGPTSADEAFKPSSDQKQASQPSIVLPKDYNPVAGLVALESLHSFAGQTFHSGPTCADRSPCAEAIFRRVVAKARANESCVLGCLVAEIFLAGKLRPRGSFAGGDFDQRLRSCKAAAMRSPEAVPRCVRRAVDLLLRLDRDVIQADDDGDSAYPTISAQGLPPPSAHQLLQPLLSSCNVPFSKHFPGIYKFLSKLHEYSALTLDLDLIWPRDIDTESKRSLMISKIAESKVSLASKELVNLLPNVLASSPESLDVILPFVKELLETPSTSILAAWELFDPVSHVLGPKQTTTCLLDSILKLYDEANIDKAFPEKHVKLYHRSFVLKLIVRFGLKTFLDNFTTPLVEAVGGYKDSYDYRASMLKSCELDDGILSPLDEGSSGDSDNKETKRDDETDAETEPEVFAFETEPEAEDVKGSPTCETVPLFNIMDHLDLNQDNNSAEIAIDGEDDEVEAANDLEEPRSKRAFKSYDSVPDRGDFRDRSSKTQCKVSDMSAESLMWLSHRLGPVLTARHLSRNLLRMLTLCYLGRENLTPLLFEEEDVRDLGVGSGRVVGDENAAKVLDCLASFAALYGEQLIVVQYVPHATELLALCKKRLTASLEAGLVGCLALLTRVVPHMRDATLMDQLQDGLLKGVLNPAVRLVTTMRHSFPTGACARGAAAAKLLGALHAVAQRIGADMTRTHLAVPSLQRLFMAFDRAFGRDQPAHTVGSADSRMESPRGTGLNESGFVEIRRDGTTAEWAVRGVTISRTRPSPPPPTPSGGSAEDPADAHRGKALAELEAVFTAELAHDAYIPFHRFLGTAGMEQALKNHSFVQHLCCEHQAQLQVSAPLRDPVDMFYLSDYLPSIGTVDRDGGSGSFGSNVAVVGNRIDLQRVDIPSVQASPAEAMAEVSRKMDDTSRHLHGNWLAYWEHEIGRAEKDGRFNFKQIKLQSFQGHTGAVRCIIGLDNENSFVSAGRDRTVRLWSLRSAGDGSAVSTCRWTYTGHRKSVISLAFLESARLAASCDSTLHLWDPFLGSVVAQLSADRPIMVLKALSPPSAALLAAAADATLRVVDTRTCAFAHELKVSISPAGSIRCLAVSPSGNRVAVGQSSGFLTLLDVRTGSVLASWKAHQGEILQLAMATEDTLVSTSIDLSVAAWNAMDGKLAHLIKGPTEPVHCLSVCGSELISGTTGNRVGVHTSIGADASFSSTRLRPDAFRGLLTAMAVLPLNRLLLLGADNGNVALLC